MAMSTESDLQEAAGCLGSARVLGLEIEQGTGAKDGGGGYAGDEVRQGIGRAFF